MIIDATDLIAGRLATTVAKKALLGEKIDIVNSENAILTGTKTEVVERFRKQVNRGVPLQGPYYHRSPDRMLRRIVRGMLPYKQERGRTAFERVMCWKGVPEPFKDQKLETVPSANVSKVPNLKFVKLGFVAKQLGGISE